MKNSINQYWLKNFFPGREFTIGVVGTGEKARIVGAMEVILLKSAEQEVYSYANKENWEDKVEYKLVDDQIVKKAEEFVLAAWRGLGCRDGWKS